MPTKCSSSWVSEAKIPGIGARQRLFYTRLRDGVFCAGDGLQRLVNKLDMSGHACSGGVGGVSKNESALNSTKHKKSGPTWYIHRYIHIL